MQGLTHYFTACAKGLPHLQILLRPLPLLVLLLVVPATIAVHLAVQPALFESVCKPAAIAVAAGLGVAAQHGCRLQWAREGGGWCRDAGED